MKAVLCGCVSLQSLRTFLYFLLLDRELVLAGDALLEAGDALLDTAGEAFRDVAGDAFNDTAGEALLDVIPLVFFTGASSFF